MPSELGIDVNESVMVQVVALVDFVTGECSYNAEVLRSASDRHPNSSGVLRARSVKTASVAEQTSACAAIYATAGRSRLICISTLRSEKDRVLLNSSAATFGSSKSCTASLRILAR